MKLLKTLIIIASVAGLLTPAYAGGPIHGARAAGMGTAFIGLADDPSALLHNPAGITQLSGSQIYTGVTVLSSHSDYSSASADETTKSQYFFPPHLYCTSDLGTQEIVFGLALDAPFGIGGRQWDERGETRYLSTENTITTFAVNPAVAWKVTAKLSMAAGVDYLYADMQMERMVDQSFVGASDGRARVETDGDGWGYNLGLLYRPNDRWQLGLAYRSEIKVDFSGDMRLSGIAAPLQPLFGGASFSTAVQTASTFPEIYSIGVAFWPNDRLVVAVDAELVRWSSFDQSTLRLTPQVPAAGVTDTTTPLDWDDSLQLKIGGEYQLDETWKLRAGYAFIQGVVPEYTLGPENPDADQHNFSIGVGWQKDQLTVDWFYNLGLFEKQRVNNTLLKGSYDTEAHYLGMSFGYRF